MSGFASGLMIKTRNVFLPVLTASVLVLSACSSVPDSAPTPYKAAKSEKQYGYSSVQLSDAEYRVMFRATEATDAALVQEYTLYRAAEIAQAAGYQYLAIVKTDVERKMTTGKRLVKDTSAAQIPVLQEEQCTMSGCSGVAQPFPAQTTEMTVETQTMEDVYFSIMVRMSNDAATLGKKAFTVSELLANKPA